MAAPFFIVIGEGILAHQVTHVLQALQIPYHTVPSPDSSLVWHNGSDGSVPTSQFFILASDTWNPTLEQSALLACRTRASKVWPVLGRFNQVYVGPLEILGGESCIDCLQIRWEHSFLRSTVVAMMEHRRADGGTVQMQLHLSDAGTRAIGELLAAEVSTLALRQGLPALDTVAVIDVNTGETVRKTILTSHLCPRCQLITPDSREDARLSFGSHKIVCKPQLRVKDVDFAGLKEKFVDRDLGYVSALEIVPLAGGISGAMARIQVSAEQALTGYGSGLTPEAASQAAVIEVLERSCGRTPTRHSTTMHGSYHDLAVHLSVLDPRTLGLYGPDVLHAEFSATQAYSWVWAYACRSDTTVLIPEQVAYYGRDVVVKSGSRFVHETSNGCAVGGSLEEAVLYGIFEVIERDGLLNTWYARLPLPELTGLTNQEPLRAQITELLARVHDEGFDVRVFNLSHDIRIPSILTIAVNRKDEAPKFASGSSTHLDATVALEHALHETLFQIVDLKHRAPDQVATAREKLQHPERVVTSNDHSLINSLPEAAPKWSFLLEDGGRKHRGGAHFGDTRTDLSGFCGTDNFGDHFTVEFSTAFADSPAYFDLDSDDIGVILSRVLAHIYELGFDVIVVHQTNVELASAGLFAVKVLIPGMTPLSFGHKQLRVHGLSRVFELPLKLGYTPERLQWKDLNLYPHPFA